MTIMKGNDGNVQSESRVWIQRKDQFTNSSAIYWCLLHARQFIRDREYKVDRIPISVLISRISGLEGEETAFKEMSEMNLSLFLTTFPSLPFSTTSQLDNIM